MNTLRWSDIWLLVAAYLALLKGCSRICDIIAIADTMNHAVVNFEELSSAMVRLEKHGYVKIENNPWQIICTDASKNLVEPIANKNSLAYKIWKAVEKELNVQKWVPREPLPHPDNNLTYEGFNQEQYIKEVQKYLEKMKNQPKSDIDFG